MAGSERIKPKPEVKESFGERPEYEEVMERLLELDVLDAQVRRTLKGLDEHQKILDVAGKRIQELEKIWSKDPHFQQIKAVYVDLLGDRDRGVHWDIDTSSYEVGKQLKGEIQKAGIKPVAIGKLRGKLKKEAQKLKSLGIPVEYAVPAKDPEKAPTVILFLQGHIDQRGELSEEARKSQDLIDKYVTALLDKEVATDLHVEGVVEGMPLDPTRAASTGGLRLAKTREDLQIKGSESPGLTNVAMVELMEMGRKRDYSGLRRILGSVLFVNNMVESAQKTSGGMVMATMGMAHEINMGQTTPTESYFPISEAIAFEGANVLVVNTTAVALEGKVK